MARRMLTEPKTALAGVTLESSFARFSPSMATLSEERTPSRPLGRWGLVVIVENQGGCEKVILRADCEEESGPY